ncbi:Remorin [Melia azedarach]|uniref:Remorin n=1 Tax=Melia azedarach TaxID=155640 RepID=A0ACC1WXA5_MELAZ|nr:Remorin [Melia azedarach]
MEYERIHKVQTGIISPSKLRMKLIGPHNRKKDGSNTNSARTSPSKIEDCEFVRNSLLASKNGDFDEEAPSLGVETAKGAGEVVLSHDQGDQATFQPKESLPRENTDVGRVKMQQFSKSDGGERSVHNSIARSFSRPMPSKWNDAEKWIMNRQNAQATYFKRSASLNQANRFPATNNVRVAPEFATYDHKLSIARAADTKRVDYCQPASQFAFEKFSFVPSGTHQAHGSNALIDTCPQSKDLKEVGQGELSCTKSSSENTSGLPPLPGATTPLRSPTSSIPSTPRGRVPVSTPMEQTRDDESQHPIENNRRDLSEQEMKEKTRREIVALGVQLGKMNIAAWASKDDEQEKNTSSVEATDVQELERVEFEKRAAVWEEAEKSKHTARFHLYKREEIKIQAWESRQKAKLEAEMRRIEAEVEQMRAQAQAKMVKMIAMARQRSEEKRAAAEARKNRDAERTAAQADYIRQTGRTPATTHFTCCGWLS